MDYFENYMKYFSSTPKEFYDELNQETINLLWDDTNRLYTIKEQGAYPFKNEWVERLYGNFAFVFRKNVNNFLL